MKLLKENYYGAIKMIYIDPPYNTGNDFIYKDNFKMDKLSSDIAEGVKDSSGGNLEQNPKTSNRYHADWLSMMYPRLKLARQLLKDDGVIFISIDDNEVANLRLICDEIFGSDNFVSLLGWQKVYSRKNQAKNFSKDYEFIACYAKNINYFKVSALPRTKKMNDRYKNIDNDSRGKWKPGDCVGSGERKNGYYEVISPTTGTKFNVPQGKHWVYSPDTMKKLIQENRIWFGKKGNSFPALNLP
ncbi:MAG: hypothetical protein ATN33_01915 [Epulopiscium sp. Nele67-Bin001]|nr:MAG: hypothetical protein ATN33_01915 [Epulopiscium sp. Nele67-Bin001]